MPDLTTTVRQGVASQYGMAAGEIAYQNNIALVDANDRFNTASPSYCGGVIARRRDVDEFDNSAGINDAKVVRCATSGCWAFALAAAPSAPSQFGQAVYASDSVTLSTSPAAGPYFGTVVYVDTAAAQVWATFDMNTAAGGGTVSSDFVAASQSLAVGDTLSINASDRVYPVQGSGGAVTPTTPLPSGLYGGQPLILIGQSDVNPLTIQPTAVVKLDAGNSIELKQNSVLRVVWDGAAWQQVGQAVHNA